MNGCHVQGFAHAALTDTLAALMTDDDLQAAALAAGVRSKARELITTEAKLYSPIHTTEYATSLRSSSLEVLIGFY